MLVFDQQPSSYSSNRSCIAYVINLPRGKAVEWASALWESGSPALASFEAFTTEMRRVFDQPFKFEDSAPRLFSLP